MQQTTDGGLTWNQIATLPHSFAEKILMADPLNGWLIANNGSDMDGKGFIYRTDDGGKSWKPINQGLRS
ncbi:MAG: hypothetical protein NHG36_08155, partial [Chromatiaceae bacterium]|nr:hypothetical protein [Candidatus Thioaporhodococcus sediminis]